MTTETQLDVRPALWNPKAAAGWSLLFTPAFGAYLHARNADTLGRKAEAKANRLCFVATLGFLLFVLISIFIPQIPDAVFRAIAIGLLVGWYIATGKPQVQFVNDTFPNYIHKSWSKPLLIAVACLVGYLVIVVAIVTFAAVPLAGE